MAGGGNGPVPVGGVGGKVPRHEALVVSLTVLGDGRVKQPGVRVRDAVVGARAG